MPHNNTAYYEFGPYRLELAQRVLTCTGEMVALTRKATDILIVLVAHAGQLVERDELLNEVWPDSFVEESNLTQTIFQLRRTLGDERAEPRYIETVARRGYRFIANVRAVQADEVGDVEGSDAADADDAAVQTVAILPFVNATGDSGYEYLAEGLTDNVVNTLSRVSKLRVMSRSAVFRYRSKRLDPRVIGMELGVGVVLVGSIVSRPPAISIVLELVEVRSGWQKWGETFDCDIKDILEVQDAITRSLLSALKLKLTGEEEKRVTTRYTENAEAYQSYLEGRYHWSKYTRSGIEKAIVHFREAIELDPNYALAYAGIIDCYLRLATNYLPPESEATGETGSVKPEHGRLSSQEDIDVTEAKVKLRFQWDWKLAEREQHRAYELKYDYPTAHQWYAAYRFAKELLVQRDSLSKYPDPINTSKLPAQIIGEPSAAEQLQIHCAVAREQIAVCNYAAAELILKPWMPQNDWPKLSSLTPHAAADFLYTLGLLTTSLATTQQSINGHRRAAALFNGSIAIFEHLNTKSRSVEARSELARCYYRQGFFDLARETLSAALSELPDDESEIKARCLIYCGMLERDAGRLTDAIQSLNSAVSIIAPAELFLTAPYHLETAGTVKHLAFSKDNDTYNDQTRFHYRSALHEYEAIGDHRSTAIAENNFGLFLLNLGSWAEAERHLRRSLQFFETLSDDVRRAQVNETLTRLYIATNNYPLAQQTIASALHTLELTDSAAILSEALTTAGIVAARLRQLGEAERRFEAAYKVSERCGDREGARRALFSLVEEVGDRLDEDELHQTVDRLRRLQALGEPSLFSERVEQTIGWIEVALMKE
jgi:DNA-binding winged helix-turn-helix (wHTH) protein/tetratricopeptide (TPR) repeat protein